MTPFQIRWDFTKLPNRTDEFPQLLIERIKRLYFVDAGRRWRYVVAGWPMASDNTVLQLPGGQPFTYLEIEVRFEKFVGEDAEEVVGRVPASSIKRLDSSPRFPYRAAIHVDLADLKELLNDRARFFDTIVHEIGHVLGLGTSWNGKFGPKLVRRTNGSDVYMGTAGRREYALAKGHPYGTLLDVPVKREGTRTTPAYHWSEEALRFDVMSVELDTPSVGNQPGRGSNVISRITAGALQDLRYVVDMRAAQPLP
jgi:hypothetical protein